MGLKGQSMQIGTWVYIGLFTEHVFTVPVLLMSLQSLRIWDGNRRGSQGQKLIALRCCQQIPLATTPP